jgi:type IV pilus assembly protein PilN
MATTTLMPLDPALSPQRVSRLLTISANLLPEEIVAGRRARRSRAVVLVALLVVVALLGSWYVYARHEVRVAKEERAVITTEATTLQSSQGRYTEVVDVQNQTNLIAKQLSTLLANDLPWAALLTTLRDTANNSGVTVLGVIGTLNGGTTGAQTTAAGTLPSTSKSNTIGTLTITGTGPDKPSIAGYVDALGDLPMLANPYLTNVSQTTSDVTFSITVDITAKARCGRFTTKCTTTGGK